MQAGLQRTKLYLTSSQSRLHKRDPKRSRFSFPERRRLAPLKVFLFAGQLKVDDPSVRIAIYPGSFDPVTNGHLDVLQRATQLFDEVIMAAVVNEAKQPLFTIEQRVKMMQECTLHLPRVRVRQFGGLLVNLVREENAVAVIRGLRAISDFEFEFQMALMNRKLEPLMETVFLTPKEDYTYLSSRIVKEIARLGGEVGSFVPPLVVEALKSKFGG